LSTICLKEVSGLSTVFKPREPHLKLGDQVEIIVPGVHRDRRGMVMEVIAPHVGNVYRYRVRFTDGTTATFFGFELQKCSNAS
jgi:hypothetical protein